VGRAMLSDALAVNKSVCATGVEHEAIESHEARNQQIRLRVHWNLMRAAIVVSFLRANRYSEVKFSVLSLVPIITALAKPSPEPVSDEPSTVEKSANT